MVTHTEPYLELPQLRALHSITTQGLPTIPKRVSSLLLDFYSLCSHSSIEERSSPQALLEVSEFS